MRIIERSKQAHDAPIMHSEQEYAFPYSWTGLSGTHMQRVCGSVKEVGTVLVEGWNNEDTTLLASWGTATYHHAGVCHLVIALVRVGSAGAWIATDCDDTGEYPAASPATFEEILSQLFQTTRRICEADYTGSGLTPCEKAALSRGSALIASEHWR